MKMRPMIAGLTGALLMTQTAFGAAYLKLGDIKGESTDTAHKDWINIQSVSFAVTRTQTSTGEPGKVQLGQIELDKRLDRSSPKLQEFCANGIVIPRIELEVTRRLPTGDGVTYYKYELTNVLVTSYSISGGGSDETLPSESLSLNFEEIKVTYIVRGATAGEDEKVEFVWPPASTAAN